MKPNNVKGFTLIELMIVVTIISVLSWFAIPKYQNYVLKATASTQLMAAIRPLQNAIFEYVSYHGALPSSFDELAEIGFVDHTGSTFDQASDFVNGAVSGIEWNFPISNSDELILAVSFDCEQVEDSGCSKVAPKELRSLTAEVTAKLNQLNGAVHFFIEAGRPANIAFKGNLPKL